MAATRRLEKEWASLMKSDLATTFILDQAKTDNLFVWSGILYPESVPYNKGGFKLAIEFPAEYPFKPPKLKFETSIYHPNIDEKGQICFPLIAPDDWKPATTVPDIIRGLIALIASPEVEHPLRAELAEEYVKDKSKFFKKAEDFTLAHAERRK